MLESRSAWGARAASRSPQLLGQPVALVVIHHTYIPPACSSEAQCAAAMRQMQDMHQIGNHWDDIGYNFCIGGDGRVYEGRGWDTVGAHAFKYNNNSVGICFIGDFRAELPTTAMLEAGKQLIATGVDRGAIHPAYRLLGHRQVRTTECPGDALFAEIRTWPHWAPNTSEPVRPLPGVTSTGATSEPIVEVVTSTGATSEPIAELVTSTGATSETIVEVVTSTGATSERIVDVVTSTTTANE